MGNIPTTDKYSNRPRKSTPRPVVPLDLEIVSPADKTRRRLDEFCREHGISLVELLAHKRLGKAKTGPRNETTKAQVFHGLIQYLRETKKWSYQQIGDYLGRDHTTIMYHEHNRRRPVTP